MAMFSKIEPVSFSANVISGDKVLADLIMDVHTFQQGFKRAWMSACEVKNTSLVPSEEFVLDTAPGMCLVDGFGRYTFIPGYESYRELWRRALYPNPLEFDWLNFDGVPFLIKYLSIVVETLEEQVDLWGADSITYQHLIFFDLKEFSRLLGRLYCYYDKGNKGFGLVGSL